MNNRFIIGFIVVIAGIAIGWYVLGGGKEKLEFPKKNVTVPSISTTPGATLRETNTGVLSVGGEKGGVKERTLVTYTDKGFAPSPVTVKAGSIVSFINESTGEMWVASDVHPTHQLLPGFDELQSVSSGGNWEYTFDKVGTWTYHNHIKPETKGTVVVTK